VFVRGQVNFPGQQNKKLTFLNTYSGYRNIRMAETEMIIREKAFLKTLSLIEIDCLSPKNTRYW
jgi:hypothetical protein